MTPLEPAITAKAFALDAGSGTKVRRLGPMRSLSSGAHPREPAAL